ncbi:hypothetical protein CEXT_178461 [Caerostris extrusa]|uniref:Uncharacterized protein n=1 Tax=Caerostris extrusa TaxID=172846 RepID=A0AAV4UFN9_CAEEX|nr:hypothetical protein CEXT_178461 [Caerostris extrusa]
MSGNSYIDRWARAAYPANPVNPAASGRPGGGSSRDYRNPTLPPPPPHPFECPDSDSKVCLPLHYWGILPEKGGNVRI